MLAESDQPFLNDSAFDMTYDWKFHHIMNEIAAGNKDATAIMEHFNWVDSVYPVDSYLMEFTSNHDENSWNGSAIKRLGLGAPAFAALTYVLPGMPLIYNGQEAGMEKSLLFFERDPIVWKDSPMNDLYTDLNILKHTNKALYNGAEGGSIQQISTSEDAKVFAALREKDADRVFAVFNLSDSAMNVTLEGDAFAGNYQDYFDKTETTFKGSDQMLLSPWEYKIYVGYK
jgi:glycosidase